MKLTNLSFHRLWDLWNDRLSDLWQIIRHFIDFWDLLMSGRLHSKYFSMIYAIYVPQPKGRGTYCFWCGSRRRPRCFLRYSITWTSGWILTKLAQTHYWKGEKKWLDFGDLDLIFKVTPALKFSNFDQKCLSAPYLLNQMTESGQTSYIVTLGWFKELIKFWWPWPNFQGHTIKTVKMSLFCTLISQTNWWLLTKLV